MKIINRIVSLIIICLTPTIVSATTCAEYVSQGTWDKVFNVCQNEAENVGETQGQANYFMGVLNNVKVVDNYQPDTQKSFKYFKKSAELNFAPAFFALSSAYYAGIGVDENPTQAFYWAKKSAESGDVDGAIYLSFFYKSGYGTNKDINSSLLWITIANIKSSEDFDMQTQEFFNKTVGTLTKESRIVLFDRAMTCIRSNYKDCILEDKHVAFKTTLSDENPTDGGNLLLENNQPFESAPSTDSAAK